MENYTFPDVFSGYRNGALAQNVLIKSHPLKQLRHSPKLKSNNLQITKKCSEVQLAKHMFLNKKSKIKH